MTIRRAIIALLVILVIGLCLLFLPKPDAGTPKSGQNPQSTAAQGAGDSDNEIEQNGEQSDTNQDVEGETDKPNDPSKATDESQVEEPEHPAPPEGMAFVELEVIPTLDGEEHPSLNTIFTSHFFWYDPNEDYWNSLYLERQANYKLRSDSAIPATTTKASYEATCWDIDEDATEEEFELELHLDERGLLVAEPIRFEISKLVPEHYAIIRAQAISATGLTLSNFLGHIKSGPKAASEFRHDLWSGMSKDGTFYILVNREPREGHNARRMSDAEIEALEIHPKYGGEILTFQKREGAIFDFGTTIIGGAVINFELHVKASYPFGWEDTPSGAAAKILLDDGEGEHHGYLMGKSHQPSYVGHFEHDGKGIFKTTLMVAAESIGLFGGLSLRDYNIFIDFNYPKPLLVKDGDVLNLVHEVEILPTPVLITKREDGEKLGDVTRHTFVSEEDRAKLADRAAEAQSFEAFKNELWVELAATLEAQEVFSEDNWAMDRKSDNQNWLMVVAPEFKPHFVNFDSGLYHELTLKERWPEQPAKPWTITLRVHAGDAVKQANTPFWLKFGVLSSDNQTQEIFLSPNQTKELVFTHPGEGETIWVNIYDHKGQGGFHSAEIAKFDFYEVEQDQEVIDVYFEEGPDFTKPEGNEFLLKAFAETQPIALKWDDIPIEGKKLNSEELSEAIREGGVGFQNYELTRHSSTLYAVAFMANVEITIAQDVFNAYEDLRLETGKSWTEVKEAGLNKLVADEDVEKGEPIVWATAMVNGQRVEVWGFNSSGFKGFKIKWDEVAPLFEIVGKTSGYRWDLRRVYDTWSSVTFEEILPRQMRAIDPGKYLWMATFEGEEVYRSKEPFEVVAGKGGELRIPELSDIERKGVLRISCSPEVIARTVSRSWWLNASLIDATKTSASLRAHRRERERLAKGMEGFAYKIEGNVIRVSGLPLGMPKALILFFSDSDEQEAHDAAPPIPFHFKDGVTEASVTLGPMGSWAQIDEFPDLSEEFGNWVKPSYSRNQLMITFYQGERALLLGEPMRKGVAYRTKITLKIDDELSLSEIVAFKGSDEVNCWGIEGTKALQPMLQQEWANYVLSNTGTVYFQNGRPYGPRRGGGGGADKR